MIHTLQVRRKHARFLVLAVAAAGFSMGAQAEYRCNAPSLPGEERACELAKLDQPDQLRRFVQVTHVTLGLDMADFVSQSDLRRWEEKRAQESAKASDDRTATIATQVGSR